MQRYMKGMSNGGSVAAHDGEILTDETLRAFVPSLYASTAHESRSDRFVPVSTADVLTALRAADFQPVFAQQARTRVPGKKFFTRHMLRLRHASLTNSEGRAFEIIISNANDGTSAYKMMAGIFRFVCLNGLFTGETFGTPVNIRHVGKDVIEQVQAGALQILDLAPEALGLVDEMKATRVDRSTADAYAEAAHLLRHPNAYESDPETGALTLDPWKAPIQPRDLLRARRSADKHQTAWHLFNIVQENAIKGGQRGMILGTNGKPRRQTTRAVIGIDESTKLNRTLWDMAVAVTKHGRA